MRVTVGFNGSGLASVQSQLSKLSGRQVKQAYANGLSDGGFRTRREWQREMGERFDRPTAYILKSVYVRKATPERLSVDIEPTYYGGKGVDPQKILQAQEFGGARRDKRSEASLRRIGILPAGYQTAIPATPFPGSDDGRGNVRGGFLVRLLSYFQAMGEQGYKANMTDKRKARLHKGTKSREGVRFFVSYGRLRSGPTHHLAPGIWAATGQDGFIVRPVLMFVRDGTYESRISRERVAERADLQPYIERRIRYHIRKMVGE
ncbi:hypothetical protein J2W28_000212 [Variovorax boronicumulans]|uniref:hypothetical protein n=1 Tax=Variovorax boronicumulans TaxID=436515 RepID=UPI002784DD7D|nr:hypothetical protein [Variovorax boronicumulans]MDP9990405.1 hypothetical protein [Variovorax boronicumulans]MDQ0001084.1 hypothetical protein [Variovorax boronicumulans]